MRRSSQLLGRTRTLLNAHNSNRAKVLALRVSPPRLGRTKSPKDAHSNTGDAAPSRLTSRDAQRLAEANPELNEEVLQALVRNNQASADSPPENDPPPSAPPSEPTPPEKPPRRTRASPSATATKDAENDRPQIPSGLDILWLPDATPSDADVTGANNTLPPPELFEEALTNLHITLHPQTQHRAAYASPTGPPVEPTLALYCPVEGGEYVLDETVRELARRTGAEVLVIDAVQLAAGEWGHFGKANAIQLPRNPLHYHPAPSLPSPSRRTPSSFMAEDDDDPEPGFFPPLGVSQMTLHVLAPVAASRGRPSSVFAPSRSAPPPSRIKAFFDDLVNIPSPSPSSSSKQRGTRPRLIYIRDFPILAPTAPTWYPHLLSAVRARRAGPIARPSSPVTCPMTIVCGVTPPLVGANSLGAGTGSFSMAVGAQSGFAGPSSAPSSRRRHTAARRSTSPPSSSSSTTTPGTSAPASTPSQPPSEWGEDDHATRAREKRLRERLRRWDRSGDSALLEDIPRLFASPPSASSSSSSSLSSPGSGSMSPYAPPDLDAPRPPIFLLGGSSPVLDMLSGQGDSDDPGNGGGSGQGRFFRASVVLPATRDLGTERRCRMERRREINELAMRMGVGGVGGVLEAGGKGDLAYAGVGVGEGVQEGESGVKSSSEDGKHAESAFDERETDSEIIGSSEPSEIDSHSSESQPQPTTTNSRQYPEEHEMWEEWSTRVEPWFSIRQIADRAVGSVVSSSLIPPASLRSTSSSSKSSSSSTLPPTLEPTSVPWSAIHRAWAAHRSSRSLRRAWSKDARLRIQRDQALDDAAEEELDAFEREEGEEGAKGVDEVVEAVKQDEDLDPHEKRLLGCIVDADSLSTTFSQVHLPQHTIDSVRTLVSLPLLYPAAFQMGILKEHAMTGCLLFGPPGTGKTLVVRALAKEAGCRMLMVSPSDVMDMYVGEGEKLVKAVFTLARRLSPCVVFLDEIDALFGARSSARDSGGAMAHRGVITEFMQEMDGLKSQSGGEERVVVIGATNRPFDLDDAVLRRLPRRLLVDLPGEKEREGILNILLRDETLAPEIDVKALAKQTESFSGSDLKHLCVSAALDAVKEDVSVPWKSSPEGAPATTATDNSSTTTTSDTSASAPPPAAYSRTIHPRHFTKALKEITPSSSESLGSLADLRKWNEQFGEGRKDKRRIQVWGKGKFGFTDATAGAGLDEGRVADPQASRRGTSSIDR
ncbi:hypothetical protein HYDPIDRAFT_144468 [Hydnomerulius pinastri MD-312]|nr:hypothetical protein HYDPIDRAFT_144468 [Hydnomerulius pinastri MD-312]